jgi:predicted nucleic acid-binding protein
VSAEDELRVVVDAQLVIAMFLASRSGRLSPKRRLLRCLGVAPFRWLWTPEIIDDYRDGAAIAEQRARARGLVFDRRGFELFLIALEHHCPTMVSASTLRAARRRLEQAPRSRDRDLDDAVLLACAVDGDAQMLASEDSDLRSLGEVYEGIPIVRWEALARELDTRGLPS